MKVVLVAMDKAPSNAFKELSKTLENRKVEVVAFLGNGDKMPADSAAIDGVIKDADFVLSGISSSSELAKEELAAIASAKAHGKPYGYYSDTWHCYNRPWVTENMKFANLLLVTNKADEVKAQRAFPGPKVVLTGNPTDEDFGTVLSKEEVQKKLGTPGGCKVIAVVGGKDANVNRWTLWSVVSALRSPLPVEYSVIYFCQHPGDKTKSEAYENFLQIVDVDVHRPISDGANRLYLCHCSTMVVPKEVMPTGEVICGADIVVGVAATEGRRAAYLRIPVINILNKPALDRLEKINQYRGWPPTEPEDGTEVAVYNADELASAMTTLLTREGFAPLKKRQEEVYPAPPAKGTAANNMADEIMFKILNGCKVRSIDSIVLTKTAITPDVDSGCGSRSCESKTDKDEKHVDVFEIPLDTAKVNTTKSYSIPKEYLDMVKDIAGPGPAKFS